MSLQRVNILPNTHWLAAVFYLLSFSLMPVNASLASIRQSDFLSILQTASQNASPVINTDMGTAMRGIRVNHDDITADQISQDRILTLKEKHEAIVWGLTEQEERRYLNLMDNKSAVRYQYLHLSPVEILGINARDSEERTHFAIMEATLQTERVARELAWAQAYKVAMQSMSSGGTRILPFDMSVYSPYNYQPVDWQRNDNLVVFLSSTIPFQDTLNTIIDNLSRTPGWTVELLFVDKYLSVDALTAWAHAHNVPVELINQGRMKLSHGYQAYHQFQQGREQAGKTDINEDKLPLVLLVREGKSKVIPLSRF